MSMTSKWHHSPSLMTSSVVVQYQWVSVKKFRALFTERRTQDRPSIKQLNHYAVKEGQNFSTACLLEPGWTTSQSVEWFKDSDSASSSSDLNIQNVNRSMNGTYTCHLQFTMQPTYGEKVEEEQNRSFYLDVLFAPENIEVQLFVGPNGYKNIFKNFSVIENKSTVMILNCSADANPKPKNFSWEGNIANDSAILELIPTRNMTGKYTCFSSNTMSITYEANNTIVGSTNETFEIKVLYPPRFWRHNNYTVLEGHDFQTKCNIDEGRTTSLSVNWLSDFDQLGSTDVLYIPNIHRTESGFYTCQLNFTMGPTYGGIVSDSKRIEFFLDVLYPPDSVAVNLSFGSELHPDIQTNITLIENKTQTVVIDCSAEGNPNPRIIWRVGGTESDRETLKLNVTRNITGSYICVARYTMNLTYNVMTTQTGEKSKNFRIDVLYPPIIHRMPDHKVLEGKNFYTTCAITDGRTTEMSALLISETDKHFPFDNLTITGVERTDAGTYTCQLNYTMDPTFGEYSVEVQNMSFQLDVLYPPENISVKARGIQLQEVTIPDNLTVVENDNIFLDLRCEASANPVPSKLSWTGQKVGSSYQLMLQASRTFSGTYTCHAENEMTPSNGQILTGYSNRSFNIYFICRLTTTTCSSVG